MTVTPMSLAALTKVSCFMRPPWEPPCKACTPTRRFPQLPVQAHDPEGLSPPQRGQISMPEYMAHPVVSSYQVPTLLALDTVGNCGLEHSHFPRHSDRYCNTPTTLPDKAFWRPSLRELQGLEIVQIYLQISSRHAAASYTGGIATRLAQSPGLDGYSHRFKCDLLKTELR